MKVAWVVVLAMCVPACSSSSVPDGGDGSSFMGCPAGVSASPGGACTEGASCPYRIACYCGQFQSSSCDCVGGRWQCPVDCYPQPRCVPDASPDVTDVVDANDVTDASDTVPDELPPMMTCNGDPPTNPCTPGATCTHASSCNPAMSFSCTCASDATWNCSPHCI